MNMSFFWSVFFSFSQNSKCTTSCPHHPLNGFARKTIQFLHGKLLFFVFPFDSATRRNSFFYCQDVDQKSISRLPSHVSSGRPAFRPRFFLHWITRCATGAVVVMFACWWYGEQIGASGSCVSGCWWHVVVKWFVGFCGVLGWVCLGGLSLTCFFLSGIGRVEVVRNVWSLRGYFWRGNLFGCSVFHLNMSVSRVYR